MAYTYVKTQFIMIVLAKIHKNDCCFNILVDVVFVLIAT